MGQKRARELQAALFGAAADEKKLFKISKVHTAASATKITHFEGDVQGKDCVIVDDMIDGGSTMLNAASLLKSKGAKSVTAYATHGILSGGALEKILSTTHNGMDASIDTLVMTDSIPGVQQKLDALCEQQPRLVEKVKILSVGPMVAAAVQQLNEREPGFADELGPRTRRARLRFKTPSPQ